MTSMAAARDGDRSERNTPLVPLDRVAMYLGMTIPQNGGNASSTAAIDIAAMVRFGSAS